MKLSDYLELVDNTGRILRKGKRGSISAGAEKILSRLDIDEDQWLEMTSNFEGCFSSFVGGERSLRMTCENLQYQRPPGLATLGSGARWFHREHFLNGNSDAKRG
jgi:hypothetical protein